MKIIKSKYHKLPTKKEKRTNHLIIGCVIAVPLLLTLPEFFSKKDLFVFFQPLNIGSELILFLLFWYILRMGYYNRVAVTNDGVVICPDNKLNNTEINSYQLVWAPGVGPRYRFHVNMIKSMKILTDRIEINYIFKNLEMPLPFFWEMNTDKILFIELKEPLKKSKSFAQYGWMPKSRVDKIYIPVSEPEKLMEDIQDKIDHMG